MFVASKFAKTLDYLQMSMGAASRRQEVIANNIANVDTPFYKNKEVTFESEFNRVLEQNYRLELNETPFVRSDNRHLPLVEKTSYRTVQARIFEDYDTNYRNDKNNVDIEKENTLLVKNTLHYNALTSSISSHIARFKSILT